MKGKRYKLLSLRKNRYCIWWSFRSTPQNISWGLIWDEIKSANPFEFWVPKDLRANYVKLCCNLDNFIVRFDQKNLRRKSHKRALEAEIQFPCWQKYHDWHAQSRTSKCLDVVNCHFLWCLTHTGIGTCNLPTLKSDCSTLATTFPLTRSHLFLSIRLLKFN